MSSTDQAGDAGWGRSRWIILIALAAAQFTNIVDFMILMPLGPQLMRILKLSPGQFGWVVSVYTFSASLSGLLAALWMDRFDRKRAFLVIYAGLIVGTLSCGMAWDYPSLLAARVLTGAFGGILGGLALAIVGDVFPPQSRATATGGLMTAFALASVLGVPLGLALGTAAGWNAPFLALVVLGLVNMLVGAIVVPPIRGHLVASPNGGEGGQSNPFREMYSILIEPNHIRAYLLVVSLMIGGFSVIPYISPYLVSNVKLREADLPWVYLVGGLLTLVFAPLVGRQADRHGKFRVYALIAPISALLMLATTHLPASISMILAVLTVGLLMLSNAGRMTVALAMVTACVESRRRGRFMSLNSSIQHLATGIGASLGGMLVTTDADGRLSGYGLVGWIATVVTIASIGLAARLRAASGEVMTT